jgi:peptide/nickel transport system permease protein
VVSFIIRRFLASLVVLLIASYLVYNLAANAGDPLSDIKQTSLPAAQKDALIAQRIAQLNLDVPPFLRYFIWLAGVLGGVVGRFNLGNTLDGQHVTDALGSAIGSTLQLVTTAFVIGIIIGVTVGIATALRIYSTFDYATTFIAFLFFSLPVFWVAVMLKQFAAINFNDFLSDPVIPIVWIAVIAVVSGVIWMGIVGGSWRRRLLVFGIAAAAAIAVFTFTNLTGWFNNPSLGPVVTPALSVGAAVIVTVLSTGWANKRARWTSLSVALGISLVLYFPLHFLFEQFNIITLPGVIGLVVLLVVLGGLAGYFWGGNDRRPQIRTGALTALVTSLIVLLDRFMQSWGIYSSQVANGRPISTVGSGTPDLEGSFWITGIDSFTHLLLPTVALVLISVASYSRYARSSLLDVLNQDYIRTARAKGLTERTVVMRHAFRNALIPITTVIALDLGALIGGAVLTETVFAWSGMGALFVQALQRVDLNPLMGFFLVTAITVIVFNFLADVVYSALDPRIRVTA